MPPVDGNPIPPARPVRTCPICGKPEDTGHRPFCSKRCADIDLHRWLSGSYSIPVVEEDEEPDGEPSESTGQPKPGPL